MIASSCFTLASRPLALIGSVWRKLVWADAKVLHASRAYTARTLWTVRIVLLLLRQGIEQACRVGQPALFEPALRKQRGVFGPDIINPSKAVRVTMATEGQANQPHFQRKEPLAQP